MSILQKKREQFRISIREQTHQAIFQQKRIYFESQLSQFQYVMDFLKCPCILNYEHLNLFNTCLIFQINNISKNEIIEIENNIDSLLIILIDQIINQKNTISVVLNIFTNLTDLSNKIIKKLITTEQNGYQFLQLLQYEIQYGKEQITSLNLLQNLWSCPLSHQINQFDIIKILMELAEQSCKQNNIQILLLIAKCFKSLLSCMSDHNSIIDFNMLYKTIKLILNYSIQDDLDLFELSLDLYCTFVHIFNLNFLAQDQQLILNLLQQNNHADQICKLCIYFYLNEPQEFIQFLLPQVMEFCKNILRQQLNNQTLNIVNMCCVLLNQQHYGKNNQIIQLYYDYQTLIQQIFELISDIYPMQIQETAIKFIDILIENSNKSQLNTLIQLNFLNRLIFILKQNNLDQRYQFFLNKSINYIFAIAQSNFSLEDYSWNAQSQVQNEIAKNEISYIEEFYDEYQSNGQGIQFGFN